MNELLNQGNELMRKASEAFSRGKMQKAYACYGKAVAAYVRLDAPPGERLALAWYTRALLASKGDATGDIQDDLDRGDALVTGAEFAESRRFAGLFKLLRAGWRRQYDALEDARSLLDQARRQLQGTGRPYDLYELELEQVRLAVDLRDWDTAVEAAHGALTRAPDPRLIAHARTVLADVFEAKGDSQAAVDALEKAASTAYEHNLKELLWELQDRIKLFRRSHPELPGES